MKRTHLIAVLAGLVASGIFASDASAMYHPGMGCWMQRDPGAGAANRIGAGGAAPVAGFIPRDQYRDGMNLYQYAASNPVRFRDAYGLESNKEEEARLWQKQSGYASTAFTTWETFLDLRFGEKKEKLNQTCKDRFICLIRLVSWVESKHGTAGQNQPGRDPMQSGNPGDSWWKELTGQSGNGSRFIGGPDAGNYWAKDLADAVAKYIADTKLDVPKDAYDLSTLKDKTKGHDNEAFNAGMSYLVLLHSRW